MQLMMHNVCYIYFKYAVDVYSVSWFFVRVRYGA